jgi:transcriptional regulator with AAA-type ATPase domain
MSQFILVYTHPTEGEKRLELVPSRSYRIGSKPDNDIVIDQKDVSRHHAVLRVQDGSFHITDLDSKNGTFINGARTVSATFNAGDMVHLSSARLVIVEVTDGAYPLGPEVIAPTDDRSGADDTDSTQKFRSEASMEDVVSLLETTATAVRRGAVADPLTWAVDYLGFDGTLVLYRDAKDNVAMVSSAGDLGQLAQSSGVLARLATDHQLARAVGTRVQQVKELGENLLVATVDRDHVLVVRYSGRSPAIGDLRSVIASVSAVLGSGRVMRRDSGTISPEVTTDEFSAPDPLGRILGVSDAITVCRSAVAEAARHDDSVFIIGERGAGRTLIARSIHDLSARSGHPFVEIDLDGLRVGAVEQRLLDGGDLRQAAENAADGTVVLDRLGSMSQGLWKKIKEILAVQGGHAPRLIAVIDGDGDEPSGDPLAKLDGDLLLVPSLRKRREDVPVLVDVVTREIRARDPELRVGFTVGALEALASYAWPGNVNELRAEVAKAFDGAEPGELVDIDDLPIHITASFGKDRLPPLDLESLAGDRLADAREGFEKWMIRCALGATGGNQSKAAEKLGLSRAGLFKKMKKLGL